MDLRTINQSTYTPYVIETPAKTRPISAKPSLKFVAESSYKTSYPDWGPMSSTQSTPQRETKRPEVKFIARSSYKTTFTGANSVSMSKSFIHVPVKNLLDMSYDKKPETTAQSFFRTNSNHLKGPSYEKHKGLVQYEVPSSIYQTEFRRAYQTQTSPYKDPKAIKRALKEYSPNI
jgi:hypothetical protein